jgi:hypothetical protein
MKITRFLGVPVTSFLSGDEDILMKSRGENGSPLKLLKPPGAEKLLRAYAGIPDRKLRRSILTVVEAIANNGSPLHPPRSTS